MYEDLGVYENNLKIIFDYYQKNDPQPTNRKKTISILAVLRFCYNYTIIDRYVDRKELAILMNDFGDVFSFAKFINFLKRLSSEMYKYSNTINQTDKFKRLLSKLNIDDPLQVYSSLNNLSNDLPPLKGRVVDGTGLGALDLKSPSSDFLLAVKQKSKKFGNEYELDKHGKLPLIFIKKHHRAAGTSLADVKVQHKGGWGKDGRFRESKAGVVKGWM